METEAQKPQKSSGIVTWPEDERPRERLLSRGPHALTDAELLAILLRTGIKGKSAVELGRQLLRARDYLTQALAIYEAIKSPAAEWVRGRLVELPE